MYVHVRIVVLKEIRGRQIVVLMEIRAIQIVLYLSMQVKYFRASQINMDPFEKLCYWKSCKPRTPPYIQNQLSVLSKVTNNNIIFDFSGILTELCDPNDTCNLDEKAFKVERI